MDTIKGRLNEKKDTRAEAKLKREEEMGGIRNRSKYSQKGNIDQDRSKNSDINYMKNEADKWTRGKLDVVS